MVVDTVPETICTDLTGASCMSRLSVVVLCFMRVRQWFSLTVMMTRWVVLVGVTGWTRLVVFPGLLDVAMVAVLSPVPTLAVIVLGKIVAMSMPAFRSLVRRFLASNPIVVPDVLHVARLGIGRNLFTSEMPMTVVLGCVDRQGRNVRMAAMIF